MRAPGGPDIAVGDVLLAVENVSLTFGGVKAVSDEAAADFLGARELTVVGIEFLVQDQEALDLRARHHLILRQ